MSTQSIRRPVVLTAIALALVAGLLTFGTSACAQGDSQDDAGVIVGTYQPQQIAQATNFQQKLLQKMQGLQQRMQKAQQDGDQAAMQQIQGEARQMQQNATQQLLDDIKAVAPQVAETTGATIIATDVTYSSDEVTTKDVTQAIIDAMGAGSASDEPMGSMEDSMGGSMDQGSSDDSAQN